MIISIFGGTVLRPGMEAEEARVMDLLDPILHSMPEFKSRTRTTPQTTANRSRSLGSRHARRWTRLRSIL
jgi:hypothetical protein